MANYDIALFDLDGTISESAEGIKYCIKLTLDEMGKPHPDLSDYSKYIGPPLVKTFQNLCLLSEEEAQKAVEIYVKHYDVEGLKRNRLYDGIVDVLKACNDNGVLISVCSSKNEKIAKEVVDLLGVTKYFDALCGSNIDGTRKEKEELIPYALSTLGAKDGARVVMIGDTKFDCIGAKKCSVDFIGVTYGYGKKEDMVSAGGEKFADTPHKLHKYLF